MYAARDPIGVNSLYWGTAALSKCSLGSSRARLLRLLRARLSAPATPLPRVLELAASTVADDAAFDHIGTGLDGATWFSSEAKALVTGGCINIEMFPRRSMLKRPPSAVSAPPELPTISWHRLGSAPAPPHGCASDSTAF